MVLEKLSDTAVFFSRQGQGVRLDGVIRNALNAPGSFTGDIINRENIDKSSDDLVAMWNADHADDPVE